MRPQASQVQLHGGEIDVEGHTGADGAADDETPVLPLAEPASRPTLSFDSGVAPRQAHQIRGAEVTASAPAVDEPPRPMLPPRVSPDVAAATAVEVDGHLELAIQSSEMETPVEEYDFLTTSSEFPDAEAPFAEAIESELADATELAIDAGVQTPSEVVWRSAGPLRTGRELGAAAARHRADDTEAFDRLAHRWTGGAVATIRTESWIRPTIPMPLTP